MKERAVRRRRRRLIVAIAVAAVLVCGYGALCAVAGSAGTVFPKVSVLGVDLGGMTCEEAEAAIRAAADAQTDRAGRGVAFALENERGETIPVQVSLADVETDCAASAARAWGVGNGAPFPTRGGIWLRCLIAGDGVLPAYAEGTALEGILDEMDAAVGQQAVQSSWEVTDTDLVLTKGQPGDLLDRAALKTDIFDRMGRGEVVDLAGAAPQFTVRLEQALPDALDLRAILAEVEQPVQDAVFDKAAREFTPDQVGVSFDADAAQALYDGLDWGATGSQALILTQPQTTVADLAAYLYQDTLGTCTTNISGTANRVHNISLAAQFFNGTVLMPGEEFSYNGVVGRRTKERGFLDAPAYVSGQTMQETGGGICQGSSTIYLAALRANLEIVERYNHGYITKYVPDGMDATVYYGAKDFRFRNDTPFPIKIVGSVSGRTLTVNILGTKTDDIKVEMTNEITGTTAYKTVYQVDASLPAGSTRVSVTPYTGYTVKVYRNVYEGGKLVSTKLESNNTYKSRDKVVLVSPADAYRYGIPGYTAPTPTGPTEPTEPTAPAEQPTEGA